VDFCLLGGQAGRICRLRQQTKRKTGVRPEGLTRQRLAVAWSGIYRPRQRTKQKQGGLTPEL